MLRKGLPNETVEKPILEKAVPVRQGSAPKTWILPIL
ncbi:MAG: hypothetical protein HFACDABA_00464 [Anaerolineales bacterium]|nr:hypothetical protein [Anaerolineales bacterium]